ncbi:ICP4b [Chelonid alphaherpesvirus 5]|uniref:ICP4b n=1 Tax=Chelonid alphaherpesvirus 5 TaxID=702736 RepID=V5NWN0_9ALPH|nr:ICP4b [Chelonid alphaherpesvirus 5]AHA93386.1 ICP4b [Chelonid alphaherpesvirus 5]
MVCPPRAAPRPASLSPSLPRAGGRLGPGDGFRPGATSQHLTTPRLAFSVSRHPGATSARLRATGLGRLLSNRVPGRSWPECSLTHPVSLPRAARRIADCSSPTQTANPVLRAIAGLPCARSGRRAVREAHGVHGDSPWPPSPTRAPSASPWARRITSGDPQGNFFLELHSQPAQPRSDPCFRWLPLPLSVTAAPGLAQVSAINLAERVPPSHPLPSWGTQQSLATATHRTARHGRCTSTGGRRSAVS